MAWLAMSGKASPARANRLSCIEFLLKKARRDRRGQGPYIWKRIIARIISASFHSRDGLGGQNAWTCLNGSSGGNARFGGACPGRLGLFRLSIGQFRVPIPGCPED